MKNKVFNTYYFGEHIVVVERIKNDINGNARYYATVLPADGGVGNWGYAKRYTIKLPLSERQIAEEAITRYEKEKQKNCK